jgi:hypothetical protein
MDGVGRVSGQEFARALRTIASIPGRHIKEGAVTKEVLRSPGGAAIARQAFAKIDELRENMDKAAPLQTANLRSVN